MGSTVIQLYQGTLCTKGEGNNSFTLFFNFLHVFNIFFSFPVMFIFSGHFPHHYHDILFYSSLPGSALYYFLVVLGSGQKLFLLYRIDCFPTGVSEISRELKKLNNQSQCFSRKKQEGTIFPKIITHVHLDGNTPDIGNRIYFKNKNRRTEQSLSSKF